MTEKRYTPQPTATKSEQEERKEQMRTQGRKGCKMDRFNITITPANHDYIINMAPLKNQTVSEFIGELIDKDREKNAELYRQVLEVMDKAQKATD